MRVALFWKVQQRVGRVEVLLASLAIGEAFDLHFTNVSENTQLCTIRKELTRGDEFHAGSLLEIPDGELNPCSVPVELMCNGQILKTSCFTGAP